MRFDWYSATVHGTEADEVLPVLAGGLHELRDVRPGRGMHGYTRGAEVVRGDRKFASVWWGGNGGGVHVQASGADAPDTAQRIREAFPDHYVTRADVCEDYTAPGAWEYLSARAIGIADQHGIKVNFAGDWHRGQDGRTVYLGAPSSTLRARVYEKGRQVGGDPNHVRAELVARPKGDARKQCSWMLPREFFGGAEWAKDLAFSLGVEDVKRMRLGTVYRESDTARTRNALARQYGPAVLAWVEEAGSEAAFAGELVELIHSLRRGTLKTTV